MNPELKTTTHTHEAEPTVTMATLPVWLIVVMLGLLYWAALALDQQGGWFESKVYAPYDSLQDVESWQPVTGPVDPTVFGKAVYNRQICVACHQANGQGLPGQFPTLHGTDWVLEPEPGRIIRLVLNGLQGPMTVNGQPYNNAMVGWKDSLNDEEIAAVLTYVRQNKEWGNNAPAVKPERVKAVREKETRTQPWTADELLKVSPTD